MSRPVRVAVLGASGRMGRMVVKEALESPDFQLVGAVASRSAGIDAGTLAGLAPAGILCAGLAPGVFEDADVVVDFSLPEALDAALPFLGGSALVTGTTGLPERVIAALEACASRTPILEAANFSTGVTLLAHLVTQAAAALPDYDVEIVEIHHRLKQDAPSGTALALGEAAAAGRGVALADLARHGRAGRTGVRPSGEIGFHAVRGGDVVGEHTVWLAGPGERVMLGHIASSRATFAQGALRAAKWLAGRSPGRYTMKSVLGIA